jgi:hypothetical protein
MGKAIIILALFLATVSAGASTSAYQSHAGCHNAAIKRVASPDGSLVVHLYYRDCTSISYTAAMMRTRPSLFLPDGDHVCYLVTLRGRLKIEAVWLDAKHVLISSPDRLSWDLGISSQQDACNDVKISYDLNVEEAPPEELSDPMLVAELREAVDLAAPCLADRHHPQHPEYFYREIEAGGHREALSLLLTNLYDYRCPVSRRAYSLMSRGVAALKIEREWLEQLRPRVTTSRRAEKIISDIRREAAAARARVRRRPPDPPGAPPPRLFGAWLDNRRVFIDSAARLVIEPRVEGEIEEFSDGMVKISAPLENLAANTERGYLDSAGKVAIPPQFERASDFHEGLAYVETKMWLDGPIGFIDKTGKIVIPLLRQSDEPRFSEGLAAVLLETGYGFIDKTGRAVIEGRYSYAGDFSEGLAWVHTRDDKAGFIDKTGRFVIGPADFKLTDDSNFSEGLAMVRVKGGAVYVDKSGRVRIGPVPYDARRFSGGLARVGVTGKYGYMDRTGRVVIRPRYELALDFSEGLAVVEVRGKGYGYIDAKGRVVIGPGFDAAWSFVDGIARVSTKERGVGYINKQGRYVWGPFH